MLIVKDLSKKYAGLDVIDRFDLTLQSGNLTVLIGPSGCGKSTLFNVLMGLSPKDGGRIILEGKEVPDLLASASFMQQKDLLLPWLTLMDNALLPCRIKGPVGEKERSRALDFFKKLDLTGFEGYHPYMVSGGMRQRCAFARTLMSEQRLVLLDEPLSALDAITRRKLQSNILQLQVEFGKTILMITHDIDEALLLGDEILLLSSRPMRTRQRYRIAGAKPRSSIDGTLSVMKEEILSRLEEAF